LNLIALLTFFDYIPAMKHQYPVARLALCLAFVLAIPFAADAQIFSDSFENESGYNLPDSSSSPPYNSPIFTGVVNTTPGDLEDGVANSGPIQIVQGTISGTNTSNYVTGQAGNNYLYLGNSGGASSNDNPGGGFSNRTPSDQTDTLLTDSGTGAGQLNISFQANTTYTLSLLMAGSATDSTQSATFFLEDATTSTILATSTIQFGTLTDSNFDAYSLTFDTAGDPSITSGSDLIQIGLESFQSSAQKFNRGAKFDDIVLTGAMDVPEPSTWALVFGGLLVIVGFRIRSAFKRA
jgi:hypothetical protein